VHNVAFIIIRLLMALLPMRVRRCHAEPKDWQQIVPIRLCCCCSRCLTDWFVLLLFRQPFVLFDLVRPCECLCDALAGTGERDGRGAASLRRAPRGGQ
jgi:hypothetical protein